MSNAEIRGRFVWHELMTTDPQAAGAFYSKVLPWKTQPSGMPEYTLWLSGKVQAAGLMAQPESARQGGVPPSWLIYIGTPDVDATAAAAVGLGGKVLKTPTDIPGIGRFAVLADPQGATFAIFTPDAAGTPAASDFSWHELATTDHQAALTFYMELFGWTRGPGHDMGPSGIYQLVEHGGAQVGGIFNQMDASKPPRWLTYIEVASVDRAAAAAKAAGGQVTQGPMEVPGGSRIAQILDPQGGAFAVHEPAKPAAAKTQPTPRKTSARRVPARKAPARRKRAAAKAKKRPAAPKRPARKSPARKSAAKRSAARKPAAKKSTRKPARKAVKRSARKPARRK